MIARLNMSFGYLLLSNFCLQFDDFSFQVN
jgi:hypothetical protein